MGMERLRKNDYLIICVVSAIISFSILFFTSIDKYIFTAIWINQIAILSFLLHKYPSVYFRKIKPFLLNCAVFLSSLLLTIAAVELYLHAAKPALLGLDKNTVGEFTDFTSRKYLDEKIFVKKGGVFRILGLGDSYAEDLQNEDKNYHNILQNKLDKTFGTGKVEIITAGIGATGPGYYLNTLQKWGDLIKPDLVLVGFFVGNDFGEMTFDTVRYGSYIIEPRNSRISGYDICKSYTLFKNFWLFQIFRGEARYLLVKIEQNRELERGIIQEKGVFSRRAFLDIEREKMWIFECDNKSSFKKKWDEDSYIILEFKKWCDERNVRLLIAILPSQFQIEEELRKEVFDRYNLRNIAIDLRYPNEVLGDFCKRNNINTVDLLEPFQANARYGGLYLVRNSHWNESGNKLAAKYIYDYITKNNLIDLKK